MAPAGGDAPRATRAAVRGALAELGLDGGGAGGGPGCGLPGAAEVRRAYRAQALRWHPDKRGGAGAGAGAGSGAGRGVGDSAGASARFQRVAAAYALLSQALREGVAEEGAEATSSGGFDDFCSSLPPEMADILEAALAGEDVRARLETLGQQRPPESFGCYPFPAFDSGSCRGGAPCAAAPGPAGPSAMGGVEESLVEFRGWLGEAFLDSSPRVDEGSSVGARGVCEAVAVASLEGEAAWVGRARGRTCTSWFPNYELRVVIELRAGLPQRPGGVAALATFHLDDTDDAEEAPAVRVEVPGKMLAASRAEAESLARRWAREAAPERARAFRLALEQEAQARTRRGAS